MGEVVGRVLLSVQKEFRVEHLSVGAGPDVIDDSGFEVDGDVPGHELASSSFLEEGREVLVLGLSRILRLLEGAIISNLVFGAVLSPHGVSKLDSGLANIHGKNFTSGHFVL